MGKVVKMSFEGKNLQEKLANGLKIYDALNLDHMGWSAPTPGRCTYKLMILEKNETKGFSCPRLGAIYMYMYMTTKAKQVICIYPRSQVSVYRSIGPLVCLDTVFLAVKL